MSSGNYKYFCKTDHELIHTALLVMEKSMKYKEAMTSSEVVKNYARLRLADREHEVFMVMFLDNQLRLIDASELFRGSIDSAAVYPREVVKEALKLNAAHVVFAHNHPSGCCEPSISDKAITQRLIDALQLVGIEVKDHIIVGSEGSYSFAERGILNR